MLRQYYNKILRKGFIKLKQIRKNLNGPSTLPCIMFQNKDVEEKQVN